MPEQSKYWSVATGSLSSAQQSANQVPSAETSSLHRNRHHWCWAFRHLCWLRRWTAVRSRPWWGWPALRKVLETLSDKICVFFFIVAGLRMLYRCCKVWSWKNWTPVTQQKKKKHGWEFSPGLSSGSWGSFLWKSTFPRLRFFWFVRIINELLQQLQNM